jgi:hypothetical protein
MSLIKTVQKLFFTPTSKIWHALARHDWFMPVVLFIISAQIKSFSRKTTTKDTITILALNAPRYIPDLEALSKHPDLQILTLPHSAQTLVNAIFYRKLPGILSGKDNIEKSQLFRERDNTTIDIERNALVNYLERFLPKLMKKHNIDGLMSCSFFYVADIDWQIACKNQNIPYFALHKENMQDGVVHDQMIKRYSDMRLKYHGHRLFLYNHLVKKVILGANICNEDTITVTGACRMDALFKKVQAGDIRPPKKQITLFSSHHCIGLLSVPSAVNYFSPNKDEGFVEYFDLVHGHLIKFAHDHPDIEVYIKPKWAKDWIDHIKAAGQKIAGIDADTIPNLHITADTPAQDLIEDSTVILGINSTTLLEAMIVGRPVILPLFAEAAEKYYDKHVYFKDYESEVFNVVKSPEGLEQAILDELAGKNGEKTMPQQMIADYLGYCDDKATDRVVQQMKEDIRG